MRNVKSEVFDQYAKIALEEGLVSEKIDKRAERRGSDDLSTIELLYGIKPNGEEDILDQAHPESVIIAPSYDKVNGLVENLKEQHDIIRGIVTKPHQAKLTQHRYAAEDLKKELISLGFEMDARKETDLAKLADHCLMRVAIGPAAIVGIVAAVAGLYTVFSQNVQFSQGLRQDAEKAMKELQEAVEDYPQIKSDVAPLFKLIQKIKDNCKIVSDVLSKVTLSYPAAKDSNDEETAKMATRFVQDNADGKVNKLLNAYNLDLIKLENIIPSQVQNLKQRLQDFEETKSDFFNSLYKAYRWINPSDMEDAWKSLETLMESISAEKSKVASMMVTLEKLRDHTKSEEFSTDQVAKEITI